jgi:hypothetical protein
MAENVQRQKMSSKDYTLKELIIECPCGGTFKSNHFALETYTEAYGTSVEIDLWFRLFEGKCSKCASEPPRIKIG